MKLLEMNDDALQIQGIVGILYNMSNKKLCNTKMISAFFTGQDLKNNTIFRTFKDGFFSQ